MAVVSLLVGACSSEPGGPPPQEAAEVVTSGFGFGGDVRQCLLRAFEDDPSATAALAIGGSASTGQRQALLAVLEACIAPEDLAEVVASSAAAGIPGTDEAEQACLRGAVLGLDDERRGLLLVGLVLSGDGTPDQLDVDLGGVTDGLFTECGVAFEPEPTPPDEEQPSTADDAGPSTS